MVAHNCLKVALNYRPLAFQVLMKLPTPLGAHSLKLSRICLSFQVPAASHLSEPRMTSGIDMPSPGDKQTNKQKGEWQELLS